jgi:hypothetical protein
MVFSKPNVSCISFKPSLIASLVSLMFPKPDIVPCNLDPDGTCFGDYHRSSAFRLSVLVLGEVVIFRVDTFTTEPPGHFQDIRRQIESPLSREYPVFRRPENRREGIDFETSPAYSEDRNRRSECTGVVIITKARSMRLSGKLTHDFWLGIVNTAVIYITAVQADYGWESPCGGFYS